MITFLYQSGTRFLSVQYPRNSEEVAALEAEVKIIDSAQMQGKKTKLIIGRIKFEKFEGLITYHEEATLNDEDREAIKLRIQNSLATRIGWGS